MKVKDVLNSKKAPVTVQSEKTLQDAMRLMIDNKISSLIVFDNDENPVGIVTEHDIFTLAHRFRGDMMDMVVGEHMIKKLITGSPDDDIQKIADIMLEKHIRHVPIVDSENKLKGIISIRDMVGYLRQ